LLRAILGSLGVASFAASAGAANLVQNGSFSQIQGNLTTLDTSAYSGAEIDPLYNPGGSFPGGKYTGDVTGWSSPDTSPYGQVFNIYNFGLANAGTANADTRYTASEPQHMNSNFTGDSPEGGAFMMLDGDPDFTGPLQQTINGLTPGKSYKLSFYWAGGELSNRTGYATIQLTGSLGGDPFATPVNTNTNPHYPNSMDIPGSFSGWSLETFNLTANSAGELLSFLAVGSPANNLPPFALLDGVSLTAVPEPSTWAMMVIGFTGLGYAAFRRRRRMAAALA
jgi:hypothetical protein